MTFEFYEIKKNNKNTLGDCKHYGDFYYGALGGWRGVYVNIMRICECMRIANAANKKSRGLIRFSAIPSLLS